MSKSLGNVVYPEELFLKNTIDQIRFYFFYETSSGEDLRFNESKMIELYNGIVIDKFLNMFQRVYKLISDIEYPFSSFTKLNVNSSIKSLQNAVDFYLSRCNDSLTRNKPWVMNKEDKFKYFYDFGEDFYNAMCVMACIIPEKVKELNSRMGLKIASFPVSTYSYDPSYRSFTKNK